MTHDITDLLPIAQRLADAARAAVLPYFRMANLSTHNKEKTGFDPVTQGDRASEQAMRQLLAQLRPDDEILGEEYARTPGTSGIIWALDPIDGTRGFMSGTPTWGVLIAAGTERGPELGIIDQPYIGERFIGHAGAAWLEGPMGLSTLRTRPARPLSEASVFTTFPEVGTKIERAAFDDIAQRARLVRYGMDCYAYALIAAGQIDLVIEAGLAPYDVQAPIAVIQAAGGIVTNWQGGPAHAGGRIIAAANGEIHAKALETLRYVPDNP